MCVLRKLESQLDNVHNPQFVKRKKSESRIEL